MIKSQIMRIGLMTATPIEGVYDPSGTGVYDPKGRVYDPKGKGVYDPIKLFSVVSGIGAVNAAHAATLLIERYSPSLIILYGIGGAYPGSGLKIGDIVLAEKEIYADTGVLDAERFSGMEKIGIPLLKKGRKKFFNEFPFRGKLVKDTLSICPEAKSGAFLTVSACSGTLKRAKELRERYNAICENMEGAPVAHICAIYDVTMLEIRGVSNIAGVRDKRKWSIRLASRNCRKAVMEILHAIALSRP